MKKIMFSFLFSIFLLVGKAQVFTPIHNAQAPDWIAVIKYFGIPYGTTPALNSTRTVPGALFYRTTDSTLMVWTGSQWLAAVIGGEGGGGVAGVDSIYIQSVDSLAYSKQGNIYYLPFEIINPVTTVSGLRAKTGDPSGIVYYTTDNGGGQWIWDAASTATDNTGTVVKATSIATGRFIRQYDGPINCQWFGIVGDGTTDNSQKFIDMFESMGEGHSFYLPAGLYMITNETMGDIIIPSYTHFFGDGIGSTIIKLKDFISPGTVMTVNMLLTEDVSTGGTSVTIENMTIDGNKQNQTWLWNASAGYGVGIRSDYSTIRNVEIKNVTANATGVPSSGVKNVIFENLYLHTGGKKAIHTGASEGLRILNCTIDDVFEGVGIHQGLKGVQVIGNRISHCYTAINLGNSAVHPYAWDYTVSGNILKYNFSHISMGNSFGNVVDSFHKEAVITGNEMSGSGRVFIMLADNVRFSNNTIRDGHVEIANSFNIIFENNTVILTDTVPLDTWEFSDALSSSIYETVPAHPTAVILVAGYSIGADSDITEGDNITVSGNHIYMDTLKTLYGISSNNSRHPKIIKNHVYGQAYNNNIRLWEYDEESIIEQDGSYDVRIGALTYATGYSNAPITIDNITNLPIKPRKGQPYFNTNTGHVQYCITPATVVDGTVTVPAVWSEFGTFTYTNGSGVHIRNNNSGTVTDALTLENDFSADQTGVAIKWDVAASETTTGRIIHRTNIVDESRDFIFQLYNGSSLVTGMTLLGVSRNLSLAQGLVAATSVSAGTTLIAGTSISSGTTITAGTQLIATTSTVSPIYYGGTASGGNVTYSSTSHATKGTHIWGTTRYDEANNKMGINTSGGAITDPLTVALTSAGVRTTAIRVENNNSTAASGTSIDWDAANTATTTGRMTNLVDATTGERHFVWELYNGSSLGERLRLSGVGLLGIGITAPTSYLHIKAGTATIAPLKFTTGTDLTTGEVGAVQFSSSRLTFIPSGTTKKRFALTDDVAPSNGQIPIGNGTDFTAANITAGSGINVSNGAGLITISNTAVPAGFAVINDADYTIASDVKFVLYRTMTAARTVTLPAVASSTNREITIRNGGNGGFNINLSQTVWSNDASSGTAIIVGEWYTIVSDGTKWWIVAKGT